MRRTVKVVAMPIHPGGNVADAHSELSTTAPRVSVVIPAFNRERFLASAVDSVLAQTLRDWELVIVDDGSSDGTLRIAREYAANHERITAVHQPNGGVAAARNRGLAATDPRSEYVTFLDSDDLWLDNALEVLVAALDAHPTAVAAHALSRSIDESGTVIEGDDLEEQLRARVGYHDGQVTPTALDAPTTFAEMIHHNWVSTPGAQLTRRSAIDRIGLFDPVTDPADDWDFALRLTRVGDLVMVDRTVLLWRRHPNTLTNTSERTRRAYFEVRRKALTDPTNTAEQKAMARLSYTQVSAACLRSALASLRRRDFAAAYKAAAQGGYRYVRYVEAVVAARWRRRPTPELRSGD